MFVRIIENSGAFQSYTFPRNGNVFKGLTNSALAHAGDVYVIAENQEDMEYMTMNFHNLPMPAAPRNGVWHGDMALFIIRNMPVDDV